MISKPNDLMQRRAIEQAAKLNLEKVPDEVVDWRTQEADYQADFLAISHLLADMEGLADDPELLALKDQPLAAPLNERSHRTGPRWALAASVILATVIGLWLFGQQEVGPDITMERYVTRVGEQKQVEMSDGSIVTLNTGSEILVGVNDRERKVILQRGEAYFEVAEDPARPFSVDAGLQAITVLGTAFNVRKSPDRLQLAVSEGLVAIHSADEALSASAPLISESGTKSTERVAGQYRVAAGWVAEVEAGNSQLIAYAPDNIQGLVLWRTGFLDFDNTPLVEVVRELNRYSAKKILIEDAAIVDLKVLGVMQIDRIDQALRGLEYTLPIKVAHQYDQIVLTGAK
ncbi:FecR domain-containing protein [Porticoccaceae bacterium LTM1]|nr:FecR domain-containing protein [Porticoccaceae bacterium LTM1]